MAAFIQSQKDLAEQSTRQNENQAIFQAQMLEVVQKVGQPQSKEYDLNELFEKFRKGFHQSSMALRTLLLQMSGLFRWRRSTKFSSVQVFSKCS